MATAWSPTSPNPPGVTSYNTRTGAVVPGNADYLAVKSGGLTGAVAATRYVGGTATVAPATGTFAVGDFAISQNGKVWICTVAGTPGTWVAVGSSPIQAAYSGNNVSVANGALANLTWDSLDAGTELLDRTNPAIPVIVASGTYALTALVSGATLTAAGYAVVDLTISGTPNTDMAVGYTTAPTSAWSVTAVFVAAAGATCQLVLHNFDGVNARNFDIDMATLVKLA